jgi:hypothetical protein
LAQVALSRSNGSNLILCNRIQDFKSAAGTFQSGLGTRLATDAEIHAVILESLLSEAFAPGWAG